MCPGCHGVDGEHRHVAGTDWLERCVQIFVICSSSHLCSKFTVLMFDCFD
jgi:hypothetical protein